MLKNFTNNKSIYHEIKYISIINLNITIGFHILKVTGLFIFCLWDFNIYINISKVDNEIRDSGLLFYLFIKLTPDA